MEDLKEIDEVRLAATRVIVEKEITENWQRMVLKDPSMKSIEPTEYTEEEAKELDSKMVEQNKANLRALQIAEYLNDFSAHLPGGILRLDIERRGLLDSYPLENADRPNSPIRRKQTSGKFFQTVDRAITAEGVPEDALLKFQKPAWFGVEGLNVKETELAIFVRLRAMGYQNQDLGAY